MVHGLGDINVGMGLGAADEPFSAVSESSNPV